MQLSSDSEAKVHATGDPAPAMAEGVAFVDGRYVPVREAAVPLLDRGFVRSDATYDVVHVWKGLFFRLDDHIARFFWSMSELRMQIPYSAQQVKEVLIDCVRLSGLREAYVQMTCTRGIPPPGTRDPRLCENRFIAHAIPFVWIADEEQLRRGLKLSVSSIERISTEAVDTRVKNFHWLDLTRGLLEAYDQACEVAVHVDRHGNLTEGAGFNIFLVKDGELSTPKSNVFEGMTRRTVIELCEELGIPCSLRALSPCHLRGADEIFVTSTAGGVMPVSEVDGRPVGKGMRPITTKIHDLYWSRQEAGEHVTPVDYNAQD